MVGHATEPHEAGHGDRRIALLISALAFCLALTSTAGCTAPGSLDNRLSYAARLKVWSCQAARMASGLRCPFFSISHSAL